MAEYRFVTFWQVHAPLQEVFNAISDSLHWPDWWQGVLAVEERNPGSAGGVGSVRRYRWKGRLPYSLCFDARATHIEPETALEATVTGDLEGNGRWSFSHENGVTSIRYDWHVRTTRRWMNLLAPFARKVFSENHHALMRQGAEGLGRLLNTRAMQVAGEDSRFEIVRGRIGWPAAGLSGVAAGTVATLVQMALWGITSQPVFESLLRDMRRAAAIVMGPSALSPPASFDWRILLAASLLHLALSLIYGWCAAPLLARLKILPALAIGALFGLAVYGVNMYGFTLAFPWFAASRNWITVAAHLTFGIALAGAAKLCDVYQYRSVRHRVC